MKLIEKLTAKFRTVFTPAIDPQTTVMAAACVAELRRQPGLAQWTASLARLSERERIAMFTRAACVFRGEWATFGLADTLGRLADKPALFRAVICELARTSDTVTPFPAKPVHPLAEAA